MKREAGQLSEAADRNSEVEPLSKAIREKCEMGKNVRSVIRPQLEVLEVTDRPRRIRMPHSGKTTLYTWTHEVEKPFTKEELEEFWKHVKNSDIWRVKGIVSMADGTTRKLDYTFGDIFEKEKDPETVSVLNKIVFIGKKYEKF